MKEILGQKKGILKVIVLAFTACLALGMLAGCGKDIVIQDISIAGGDKKEAPGSVTFKDDLGNEVTVENPERVVACMGSFANVWELAGGTLVGATEDSFAEYGLDADKIKGVGSFTAPNLEEIIDLEPDFVIMTGAATGKDGAASQVELRDALKASGIEVAYFTVTVFEDYLRMLRVCCDITGREDLYEENGTAIEEQIDIITQGVSSKESPSVLLMTTYSQGTRVQNSSTMTGAMLKELGVTNLADEHQSLLRDFSLEAVIEANPDFILVVPMGNDDEAALKNLKEATAANPAWAELDAVKNGRYVTLDKTLFLYKPNAKWSQSYLTLADILYAQ